MPTRLPRIKQGVLDVPGQVAEKHEAEFAVLHEDADGLAVFGVVIDASVNAFTAMNIRN